MTSAGLTSAGLAGLTSAGLAGTGEAGLAAKALASARVGAAVLAAVAGLAGVWLTGLAAFEEGFFWSVSEVMFLRGSDETVGAWGNDRSESRMRRDQAIP